PCAFETLEIVDLEPSITRARRDDHRSGRDLAAVGEDDHVEALLDPQARDRARGVEMRAEAHRLERRARDEVVTRDPFRKAHVVLDARAGTGLAARGNGVERDGIEAL